MLPFHSRSMETSYYTKLQDVKWFSTEPVLHIDCNGRLSEGDTILRAIDSAQSTLASGQCQIEPNACTVPGPPSD